MSNERYKRRNHTYQELTIDELIALANGGMIRTFSRQIYRIKGLIAENIDTKEKVELSQIFSEIRTVQNKFRKVVARRKNPQKKLRRVYRHYKKVKK